MNLNEEYHNLIESRKNEEEYIIKQKLDLKFSQVYIGLDKKNNKSIFFSFNKPLSKSDMDRLPKWSGLSILNQKLFNKIINKEEWYLIFREERLNNNTNVFLYLVKDILKNVQEVDNSNIMLNKLKATLSKWEHFFRINLTTPFTNKEIQGLFGELIFLNALFDNMPKEKHLKILEGWDGLSGTKRDFHFGNIFIEVKTSRKEKPYSVRISSEDQLFIIKEKLIYLFCYMLKSDNQLGIDLKFLLNEIESKLLPDYVEIFRDKLIKAGILREVLDEMKLEKYLVQELQVFEVKEGFPLLNRTNIPKEIFNIKYSIALDGLTNFKIDVDKIIKEVKKLIT